MDISTEFFVSGMNGRDVRDADTVLVSMSLRIEKKMPGLGLKKTESIVCSKCEYRFQCYTSRDSYDGLCDPNNFSKLDDNTIRQIHIMKAKRQGHYIGH